MQDKEADTQYNIIDPIRKRWSPRSFAEQMLSREQVEMLVEAASWAPSSRNEQPWRFLVGFRGDNVFDHLYEWLADGNKPWVKNASVLMLVYYRTTFSRNEQPNAHAFYDTGAAVGMLSLQAVQHNIYLHQMAGFDRKAATEFLPDQFEAATMIALGYRDDPDKLPEPYDQRELAQRNRKGIGEVLSFDRENPAS